MIFPKAGKIMSQIETSRLRVIPLSLDNLELCLDNYEQMECNLGLKVTGTTPGERQRNVLKLRLDKAKEDPKNYLWNTVWIIVLCKENCKIGSIMLKGRALDSNNFYVVDDTKVQHHLNGYSGDAISKLAKFENIYDDLISKQSEISKELEKLRLEGKTHSVKFKQQLADKITNNNIIILFKTYGL